MITHDLGEGVQAFTAGRGDTLPFEVTQALQVHGIKTMRIDRPGLSKKDLDGFDALITNVPGLAIGVRTADCIPILLYDEYNRAVAAVHSGWKGTAKRIVQEAIYRLHQEYSTTRRNLKVIIGPGICSSCFQVGEEVPNMFKVEGFPMDQIYSWNGPKVDGDVKTGHHIDLIEANKYLLQQEEIPEENIFVSGICTFENDSLFSARREGVNCGRNITAIMVK